MTEISEFEELQRDLNDFYGDGSQDHEQFYKLFIGDLCAVLQRCTWFRGVVQGLDDRNILAKVFLVDFGHCIQVPSFNIHVITTYFASFGPLSFPCRLTRINDDDSWTEETLLEKFIDICQRAGTIQVHYLTNAMPYVVHVLVSQYAPTSKLPDAYVLSSSYAVLAIEKIQSNQMNWIASNIVDGQRCHNSAMMKKIEVTVTAVQSPAEIYVHVRRFDAENRKMHAAIQRWATEQQFHDRNNDRKWQKGEQCLVYARRSHDIEMWYRGRIDAITDNQFQVFLRDFGDVITVHEQKVMRTTDKLVRMRESVIKCHLDGVNSWLPSSISILQSLIGAGGASFAPKVNDSVPITLWRPTQETACGVIVEWMNLNRWLVVATVIEVMESYIYTTQAELREDAEWKKIFENPAKNDDDNSHSQSEHFDLSEISLEDDLIDASVASTEYDEYDEGAAYFRMSEPIFYELNDWTDGEVERWLPSVQTPQLIFSGTPIHIDLNGVLYIHDSYRQYLAQHLSAFITRSIESDENVFYPFAANWTVGQTCFAKYDGNFHRGIIQSINRAKCICKVKFVDYGNCDLCKFEDMRPATQCGHIPVLVRKYCLDNVLPISDDNRWPLSTVNFMRTEIIQHMCTIRIQENANRDNGILPCAIFRHADRIDLKTRLIAMGLVYERVTASQQRR